MGLVVPLSRSTTVTSTFEPTLAPVAQAGLPTANPQPIKEATKAAAAVRRSSGRRAGVGVVDRGRVGRMEGLAKGWVVRVVRPTCENGVNRQLAPRRLGRRSHAARAG
jgi:hypothetical protein